MLSSASYGHPNLVASTYISPAMRNRMYSILSCSTTSASSQQELYRIRSSAMQIDATIFLAIWYRTVSTSSYLQLFRLFNFFDFFDFATAVAHSLPSIHLILYRPSLVASYAPSEAPEPLFTSDLCGCCRKHHCRQILTSGEEILASAPAPTPHLFLHHLSTAGYEDSYWSMVWWNVVCAMRSISA